MKNEKLKIIYIANIRLPTEKAHGIQIMEMCSAFANAGDKVTLVVPKRKNHINKDPFQYYDVKENFKIRRLPCVDVLMLGKIGYLIQTASFGLVSLIRYGSSRQAVFFTRDQVIAILFRAFGRKVVWEGHRGEKNILIKLLILMKVRVVAISGGLKNLYTSMGISQENIIVAPDAVDVEKFSNEIPQEQARKELGLPLGKKIILYKGGMFAWKGPATLAQSYQYLRDQSTLVVFVGGFENDVVAFKKEFGHITNLLILGNKPRQEMSMYQKAADILVIPNSAKNDISRLYTSPMKLFEYMASRRPIIASDLPSIREILNESNSYFFTPDDAMSLAQAIDLVLENYEEAEKRAEKALQEVQVYSWKNRARSILEFMQQ